jgi:hypothetical protein
MKGIGKEKMKRARNYTLSLALIAFANGYFADSYSSAGSSYVLGSFLLVAAGVIMIVIENSKG